MMLRSCRKTLFTILTLLFPLAVCGGSDTPQRKPIVNVILETIRRPRPGEFAKPEAVVAHLFECVKKRDFDEALKCFPIHEHYKYYTFDVWVKNVGMFSFVAPLPEGGFHNLSLAMRYSDVYDRVSAALLAVDLTRVILIGEGNDSEKESLEEIKQKFDISKLKDLAVKEIRVDLEVPKERISDLHKALGVNELCMVKAEVTMPGEKSITADFMVAKIKDNWRILGLS